MKKIITAAAIAAMAAGFATADAKFSVYYRGAMDVVQHEVNDNLGDSHGTSFFSNVSGERSNASALKFNGSAEYGGFEVETDVKQGSALTPTKYNGWINFGNFMIKSGAWDGRAVGRVNASAGPLDSWWGEIYKPGLAVAGNTAGNGIDVGQQSNKNQATMIQYSNKDLGLEARFGWWDTDGVATTFASKSATATTTYYHGASENEAKNDAGVTAKKGLYEWDSTYSTSTTYDYEYETEDYVFNNSLWFGELGYTIKDVGRILATTKIAHNDYTFAGFFEPKLANVKALTSLIGFTYEYADRIYVSSGKDKNADKLKKLTADDTDLTYDATVITNKEARDDKNNPLSSHTAAVDFRARYDLADMGVPLAITFMYNWTFGNTVTDGTSRQPGWYASWGLLNFRYTLNENVIPFFSAIYTSGNTWAHNGSNAYYKVAPSQLRFDDPYNFSLRFVGGAEFYNTKNAVLYAAVIWDASNMMERDVSYSKADGNNAAGIHAAGVKAIHIPVAIKVSM